MKHILIFLIRCYQIIPFASHKLCRFTPTCSEYMIEAINTYGIKRGLKLGLIRLKKCRPGSSFGYDPVPIKGNDEKWKKLKPFL